MKPADTLGLFFLIVVFVCVTHAALASPDRGFVRERDGGIWGRLDAAANPRQLCDAAHFIRVDRPDGPSYVLLRTDHGQTRASILVCDKAGNITRQFTIDDEDARAITAIDEARFLADGRLFVVGHVDPSCAAGIAVDCRDGSHAIFQGNTFTWSRDARHIAYFRDAQAADAAASIWIDSTKACDGASADARDLMWDEAGHKILATFDMPDHSTRAVSFRR